MEARAPLTERDAGCAVAAAMRQRARGGDRVAWARFIAALALPVAVAACGGSDIDAVKDAFRGVMAVRAEAELLSGNAEGMERGLVLQCEAHAEFERVDRVLHDSPSADESEFLQSGLYERLAHIGMGSVDWCLEHSYLRMNRGVRNR